MMLKTDARDLPFTDAKGSKGLPLRKTLRLLGSLLAAFVLAGGSMVGGMNPFAPAFVASRKGVEAPAAFIGAVAGYLLRGDLRDSLPYLIAMLAILGWRFFSASFDVRMGAAGTAGIAAVSLLAGGLLPVLTGSERLMGIVLLVCEAAIGGAFTFFLLEAEKLLREKRPLDTLRETERAALALVATMFLTALCAIEAGPLNAGRLLGALVTILFAKRQGAAGGAVAGICAAGAAVLASPALGERAVVLAAAGLAAGLFADFGKLVTGAMFLSVGIAGALVLGVDTGFAPMAVDIAGAFVMFLLLPSRVTEGRQTMQRQPAEISRLLASRLSFAAATMRDIRLSVEQVARVLDTKARGGPAEEYAPACERVCRRCGFNGKCWQENYDESAAAFGEAMRQLRKQGFLRREELPETLKKNCRRQEELTAAFLASHREHEEARRGARRLAELRAVLYEQFEGVADMLSQISVALEQNEAYDTKAARIAASTLESCGMKGARVAAGIDPSGRMSLDAFASLEPECRTDELAERLSDALGREFDLPEVLRVHNQVRVTLFEKATFVLDTDSYQLSNGGDEISGDCCETFFDGTGYAYLILSDGMGSGKQAAIDSTMACSLLGKLLRAGIGCEPALRILSASLRAKSAEESFATVDLCRIDLYTGRTELLKAGAAATFVRKGDKAAHFESTTLPVGIVGSTQFERRQLRLGEGDVLLLVSDGVTAGGNDWIEAELELHRDMPAAELAQRIAQESRRRRVDGREDDITVLAARLTKGV